VAMQMMPTFDFIIMSFSPKQIRRRIASLPKRLGLAPAIFNNRLAMSLIPFCYQAFILRYKKWSVRLRHTERRRAVATCCAVDGQSVFYRVKLLVASRASLCCRRHMANNSNAKSNLANVFMVIRLLFLSKAQETYRHP